MKHFRLKHLAGSKQGSENSYELDSGQSVQVGRNATNQLQFDPVKDDFVSGDHAVLKLSGCDVVIEDLQSRNGTLVNGNRISGPTILKEGDQIQFGVGGPTVAIHLEEIVKTAQASVPAKQNIGQATAVRLIEDAMGRRDEVVKGVVRQQVEEGLQKERKFTTAKILLASGILLLIILAIGGYNVWRNNQLEKQIQAAATEFQQNLTSAIASAKTENQTAIAGLDAKLEQQREELFKETKWLDAVKNNYNATCYLSVEWQMYNKKTNLPVKTDEGDGFFEIIDVNPKERIFMLIKTRSGGTGSGFCIDSERGHILTNGHVVKGWRYGEVAYLVQIQNLGNFKAIQSWGFDEMNEALREVGRPEYYGKNERLEVQFPGGQPMAASIIRESAQHDVALLRCDLVVPAVVGVDEEITNLEVGQKVAALGYPGGALIETQPFPNFALTIGQVPTTFVVQEPSVSVGVVSKITESNLQTDAAINSGNSGGPIINNEGKVIGLAYAKSTGSEGIAMMVPIKFGIALTKAQ